MGFHMVTAASDYFALGGALASSLAVARGEGKEAKSG
jgi:hypothetical protein